MFENSAVQLKIKFGKIGNIESLFNWFPLPYKNRFIILLYLLFIFVYMQSEPEFEPTTFRLQVFSLNYLTMAPPPFNKWFIIKTENNFFQVWWLPSKIRTRAALASLLPARQRSRRAWSRPEQIWRDWTSANSTSWTADITES